MILARSRSMFLLAFGATVLVMGGALYLEYQVGLQPCSLCIVQRVFLVLSGLAFLLAAVHFPATRGMRAYNGLALASAGLGALAAMRQLWLQNHAEPWAGTCRPGLWHLLRQGSLKQNLEVLVLGTPDCGAVNWTLLDLSLPEWSLLAFAGFALFAAIQLLHR